MLRFLSKDKAVNLPLQTVEEILSLPEGWYKEVYFYLIELKNGSSIYWESSLNEDVARSRIKNEPFINVFNLYDVSNLYSLNTKEVESFTNVTAQGRATFEEIEISRARRYRIVQQIREMELSWFWRKGYALDYPLNTEGVVTKWEVLHGYHLDHLMRFNEEFLNLLYNKLWKRDKRNKPKKRRGKNENYPKHTR